VVRERICVQLADVVEPIVEESGVGPYKIPKPRQVAAVVGTCTRLILRPYANFDPQWDSPNLAALAGISSCLNGANAELTEYCNGVRKAMGYDPVAPSDYLSGVHTAFLCIARQVCPVTREITDNSQCYSAAQRKRLALLQFGDSYAASADDVAKLLEKQDKRVAARDGEELAQARYLLADRDQQIEDLRNEVGY
jgi:hypothetical protein